MVRGFLLLVGFLFGCLTATTAAAPPSREAIAQAIQQLGDQRFTVREKASAFLKAAGRAAEPALRAAVQSHDLEVARRAQVILDDFNWGLYPDTPLPLAELIHRYRGGDEKERQRVLDELLAKGKPT